MKTTTKRTELNTEDANLITGGKIYNVGDHVEVKNLFFGTSGGTIVDVGICAETGERIYEVEITNWYDLCSDAWYHSYDFE